MADKKISQLTAATTPLAGTEVLPIVQNNATDKVSVDNLTKGRVVNALSFDTDVASAGVTLSGTTLSADGTDANITINLTPKGSGVVQTTSTEASVSYRVNTQNAGISTNNYSEYQLADNGAVRAYWRSLRDGLGTIQFAYNGSLVFLSDATGTPTEASRFTGAGNLTFPSGKGIDFSATASGSGTMTSELLADYEEGTWTPVLGGISGTSGQSYSKQVGRYTKIGRMVFFTFEATLTAKGSLSNEAIVGGLPYTIGSEIGFTSADINTFANLGQSVVDITLKANPGDTTFYVWATTAAATSSAYTISWQIYTDTTTLRGGGMYIAA